MSIEVELKFLPEQIIWVGDPGKTALEIAVEAGVAIDGNCAGAGTCGKCKVRIVEGNTADLCDAERQKLTQWEVSAGYRLACRFRPTEDAVVEIPVSDSAIKRKTTLLDTQDAIDADHLIYKRLISVKKASLLDQRSDESRIIEACKTEGLIINSALLANIPGLLKKSGDLTVTLHDKEIIHLEEGNTVGSCFGVSFDIGTTTVVGMLWDLTSAKRIAAVARTNPQAAYGADVISRINYAAECTENLSNIHGKIIECLNGIIDWLAAKTGIKNDNIYDVTVAGNTTMGHFFMGVEPIQLAMSPFAPVFRAAVSGYAKDFKLDTNNLARYYLLPSIAGHVGSDITAGLIATGLLDQEEAHLMLDVGTNGEIVLAMNGKAIACSTAAGPAFEGASIFQGMRAAAGAIEAVQIMQDEVIIKTIDHQPAAGLCGSGIIDAVAELVRTGIVDKTGKLLDENKLIEKGISRQVAGRVRKGAHGKEFVLCRGENSNDIVILQKDIREVQLAKAAISAGIKVMLHEMRIKEDDIARILIAGAFGNYIKVESAIAVGLIPDIDRERIAYVGNAAGIGASQALLSCTKRREAEKISGSIMHLELSTYPEFQDAYLKAMTF